LVEWIFAFETRRIVSRSKDNVVDDIVKLLEYAKGFPQEHLMSAGQLSLNRHITHNPGIEPSLGGLSAIRNVWSAALPQAKSDVTGWSAQMYTAFIGVNHSWPGWNALRSLPH
jgi:hypothetical protein